MTSDGFEGALTFVLIWEGGLSNDPDDPGGRTFRGVTQREYDRWRSAHDEPLRDVADLADGELQEIYWGGYWLPSGCATLPSLIDLLEFDTAVNMGVVRAIRMLQAEVGVAVDGVLGPLTLQALSAADPQVLMIGYCERRQQYYQALVQRLPDLSKYLQGWLNRLNALRVAIGILPPSNAELLDFGVARHSASIPDFGTNTAFDF